VPAAAVIRRIQALSGITGRKELRRCLVRFLFKGQGSTLDMIEKPAGLSMGEVDGISSVGVKSVDIRRNTDGVGSLLAHY
jgi:hypothetical protein